ncbi:MAG: flippase-like domain-containing protein [Candidatus Cloacimonetes bacterium]|nr:flippase-like domain-containing protein [Candidatus Cloacimonadota bacterium]
MSRSFTKWFLKLLLFLAVSSIIYLSTQKSLAEISSHSAEVLNALQPSWLLASLLLSIVYRVVNACGWTFVVRALHHPLNLGTGVKIWLISETMRWLPGSIWSYGTRVYQGTKLGMSKTKASISVTVELILTLTAWAISALLALGFSPLGYEALRLLSFSNLIFGLSVMAIISGILFYVIYKQPESRIHQKLSSMLGDLILTLRERPNLGILISTLGFFTLLCVFNALGLYMVLMGLAFGNYLLADMVVVNSLGFLAGFFVLAAPGGIGIREGFIALCLSQIIPLQVAVLAAILFRLVQILSEILCLLPFLPELLRRNN